ncbi:MAG: tRNA epoxyqueuosine(34) reductase QueG, partial [Dinghuibacter sp.]|nr:tRNA epoxyqueuosine(34) reductase QueG [Dinghuibacter sp.]
MAKPNNTATLSRFIKQRAAELGFFYTGIARAEALPEDARRLEKWLQQGMHGSMHYMERYFEQRTDPRKLVPGARSVVTLLMNYFPNNTQTDTTYRFSKYAYGRDYHDVIREKLKTLLAMLKEQAGDINGRGFVDSAPVLERTWAQRSGLGWVGRNGNLINKKSGSFFFIATLVTDLELACDLPLQQNYCGTCNRCVEACPTNAILPGNIVNGSKCISYY